MLTDFDNFAHMCLIDLDQMPMLPPRLRFESNKTDDQYREDVARNIIVREDSNPISRPWLLATGSEELR